MIDLDKLEAKVREDAKRFGEHGLLEGGDPATFYSPLFVLPLIARIRELEAQVAAAPELLEACLALITYDQGDDGRPDAGVMMMIEYDAALTKARAAVAKATSTRNPLAGDSTND